MGCLCICDVSWYITPNTIWTLGAQIDTGIYSTITHFIIRQWQILQGLYSLSGKTSYHQILRSLEAAGLDVIMIASLCNLTHISAAMRSRCLSNFKAIGKVWTLSSWLRDFTKSCDNPGSRLVNKGPGQFWNYDQWGVLYIYIQQNILVSACRWQNKILLYHSLGALWYSFPRDVLLPPSTGVLSFSEGIGMIQ